MSAKGGQAQSPVERRTIDTQSRGQSGESVTPPGPGAYTAGVTLGSWSQGTVSMVGRSRRWPAVTRDPPGEFGGTLEDLPPTRQLPNISQDRGMANARPPPAVAPHGRLSMPCGTRGALSGTARPHGWARRENLRRMTAEDRARSRGTARDTAPHQHSAKTRDCPLRPARDSST